MNNNIECSSQDKGWHNVALMQGHELMTQQRYQDAQYKLRELAQEHPSLRVKILLSKLYEIQNDSKNQKYWLTRAHHTVPKKIQPLYQLFLLEAEMGNTSEALKVAKEITLFVPSKNNLITKQIVHEANSYIKNHDH